MPVSVAERRFELAHVAWRGKIASYARNALRGANQGHARGVYIENMDAEEIEQELLSVLWKCVQSYDPDSGATFNTFAQRAFQNQIVSLARKSSAKVRKPTGQVVSLDVEEVRAAIDAYRSAASSEEEFFALRMVEERLAERGKSVNRDSRTAKRDRLDQAS